MPIDPRMVAWDKEPSNGIDPRMVKWESEESKPAPATTSAIDRVLRGIRDPIDAGAQLLEKSLPDYIVKKLNETNNWLAKNTGIVAEVPNGGVSEMINQLDQNYFPPEGVDWYRIAGNIASPANLAIASKIPMAGTLGKRILTGAATGAVMAPLTQPVIGDAAQSNFFGEKAKQAALGAAGGAIIPAAFSAAARIISPKASLNPNVKLLKDAGVNPTIGQTFGGRLGAAEEKMQSVPILGDMISRARNTANKQFEAATYNKALSPIGESLPNGLSGREAVAHTENVLSNKYNEILNKIGAIKPDAEFYAKVNELQGLVNKKFMPQSQKNKFGYSLQKLNESVDENGVITSDVFKELESSLGSDARKLASSQDVYEDAIGKAVKQLQANLRDMLQRQAGDSADELKKVNAGWAQFKRIQKASSALGAESGEFSPAQFQSAIKALDKSKDKAAFARGDALMQELGDAGKNVLSGKIGNSFTADRLMFNLGALGSGAINPGYPAGLGIAGVMYSQPMQRLLNAAITMRGQSAPALAENVRRSSLYALPAAGYMGAGLLDK